MRYHCIRLRIGEHIRILVSFCALHSIESHGDKFAVKQIVEQVFERFANAALGDWNLPQIWLGQVGVRQHGLFGHFVFVVDSSVQNLLQNGHNVMIEVALAS